MRRLSARTTRTALAAIVLPALMVTLAATPAAAAGPTVVVAAGYVGYQDGVPAPWESAIAACHPDGNGATIPLEVNGADPRTLTGASDNQTLLPDSAIIFDAGAEGRPPSVDISVVPSNSKPQWAAVTITVSNGTAKGTVLINVYADGPGDRRLGKGTLDGVADLMLGQGGNDHLIGGTDNTKPPPGNTGRDTLCGGPGDDHLEGQDGDDTVDGQAGNDTVKGAQGNDIVRGGEGDDKISGRGGSDLYSCGTDTSGNGSLDIYYGYRANPSNGAQADTSDGSCDDATNGSHK